jgi:predicted neuraminidase
VAVLVLITPTYSSAQEAAVRDDGRYGSELIFPLESWHNHGSSVVELPSGELLTSWFHGSGERRSDDVAIFGARRDLAGNWSAPFVLADTPGFPDTNCTMMVDGDGKLWLFYPTILDNRWEGALLKMRVAADPSGPGPPRWTRSEVLHMKPGEDFAAVLDAKLKLYMASIGLDPDAPAGWPEGTRAWVEGNRRQAADKLTRRLGWFTRPHPVLLDGGRILVGLYSDGFSVSAATWSDDDGATWSFSEPIVGGGNVQPSFARREDGTVVAFMRDNGPAPKRVQVAESSDRGATWDLPESGAGVEVLALASGRWIVVHNDTVRDRHQLAVSISDDEGRSFPTRAWLERAAPGRGRFHYPSVLQARDGTLHVTYSYFVTDGLGPGKEGKSIKHAWFDEAWLLERARPVP